MSGVKTSSYYLVRLLAPQLEPITTNMYTVKNSFRFYKENTNQDLGLFMVSLDIKALFTKIPLEETINVCCDSLFSNYAKVNNINKIALKNF